MALQNMSLGVLPQQHPVSFITIFLPRPEQRPWWTQDLDGTATTPGSVDSESVRTYELKTSPTIEQRSNGQLRQQWRSLSFQYFQHPPSTSVALPIHAMRSSWLLAIRRSPADDHNNSTSPSTPARSAQTRQRSLARIIPAQPDWQAQPRRQYQPHRHRPRAYSLPARAAMAAGTHHEHPDVRAAIYAI